MPPTTQLLRAPPAEIVAERLQGIRNRIADAGRDPGLLRIVAVTKGFDESAPLAALEAGLTDVGENYPEELIQKASALAADSEKVTWHMIGAIQRRRVKDLFEIVDCWQTVSRDVEVSSISRYAPAASIFLQVDTTGLPNRNGSPIDGVRELLGVATAAGLRVRGLMTIGPGPAADRSMTVAAFSAVRDLAEDLQLEELSMGMTEDLEAAVRAGSTMLRMGRALFGERTRAEGH